MARVVGSDAARPFVPSAVDLANPNFLLSFGKVGRMVSASVSGMVSAQGVVQEMLTFADIGPVLHGEKLLVQRPEGGQPSHWMLTNVDIAGARSRVLFTLFVGVPVLVRATLARQVPLQPVILEVGRSLPNCRVDVLHKVIHANGHNRRVGARLVNPVLPGFGLQPQRLLFRFVQVLCHALDGAADYPLVGIPLEGLLVLHLGAELQPDSAEAGIFAGQVGRLPPQQRYYAVADSDECGVRNGGDHTGKDLVL